MQIKAMMRCHHTTVGMTIIKKTRGSVEEDVKIIGKRCWYIGIVARDSSSN